MISEFKIIEHNKKEIEKWFHTCPLCCVYMLAHKFSEKECKECNYLIVKYDELDSAWLHFPYSITINIVGQRSLNDARNVGGNIFGRSIDIYYRGSVVIQYDELITLDIVQLFEKTKKRTVFA